MEHFIIGTAGHIDHGKTSLIKALTQMDCDTHPEEKKRGITINLGFAYLKKSDGDYMAFVDVPGHHRFISNMVAGATGIDFVMLVVAADDGVMPQTKEHLKICSLLGIKNGIVVINKCDAVETDEVELCHEEIEDFVKGTFLENKPIFEVSSLSGKGIDELRNYLLSGTYELTLKPHKDFFRMSIDRIFNVSGFGAVVTGTIAQGEIRVGDSVSVISDDIQAKVRGIQRHSEQVESSEQGTRVALDLTGVKKEDIQFGDILCAVQLPNTEQIDVHLVLMNSTSDEVLKFDAVMLCGTEKLGVKVRIVEYYREGNSVCATAQIDISKKWYFSVGDYFVLRNSSSDMTIAGGYVIDPLPLNHKKMTPLLQEKLRAITDDHLAYIEHKVEESVELLNLSYFVHSLQLKREKILELLDNSLKVTVLGDGILLASNKLSSFETILMQGFEKFAKSNPLSVIGVSRKKLIEFTGDFSFYKVTKSNDEALSLALERMESEGKMIRSGNQWRLAGARTEISDTEKTNIKKIERIIEEYGYAPLEMDEIFSKAKLSGIDDRSCKYIITYLSDLKKIVRINEMAFWCDKLNESRRILVDYLKNHADDGIKVAEYRDLIGTNRKVAMIVLEVFDKEKIVVRKDDVRFLI